MGGFEFGIYVYAWTWLLLVGDIIHLGLPLTAQRTIPEYTQRGELDRLRGFLIGSRWIVFAVGNHGRDARRARGALARASLDRGTIMPLYLACVALPFYTLANMLDGLARSYNAVNIALLPPFVLRPLMLIAVMAVAHFSGFLTDATTGDGGVRVRHLDDDAVPARHAAPPSRPKVPAGPRSYDVGGGSRPRCRSSRSGASTRC